MEVCDLCSDLSRGFVACRVCCSLRAAVLSPWNETYLLSFRDASLQRRTLASLVDFVLGRVVRRRLCLCRHPMFCSAIAPSVRRVGHARHAEAPLDRFERLVFTGREQDSILDRQVAVFRLQLLLSRFLAGLFQLHCIEKARALVRCS